MCKTTLGSTADQAKYSQQSIQINTLIGHTYHATRRQLTSRVFKDQANP